MLVCVVLFHTNPKINTAKQKIVKIIPYFFCFTIGMHSSTMYSTSVKHKLYKKSAPSVVYDNAKPQIIEQMC